MKELEEVLRLAKLGLIFESERNWFEHWKISKGDIVKMNDGKIYVIYVSAGSGVMYGTGINHSHTGHVHLARGFKKINQNDI